MSEPYIMPSWEQAACKDKDVDPDWFFPERTAAEAAKEAKNVCFVCPVTVDCLRWAFEIEDEWAVLGGTTPRERNQMRKEMRRRKAS